MGLLKKIGKGISKAAKGIGKGLKKIAPVALPILGTMIPGVGNVLGAAIGGAVAGGTKKGGNVLKNALGGAASGAVTGMTGGLAGGASSLAGKGMLGGLKKIGGDFLKKGGIDLLLSGAGAISAADQARKAGRFEGKMLNAVEQDYAARAPMRQLGHQMMLDQSPIDLRSVYRNPSNPFA